MKALCPFDKNHVFSSQEQLKAHIEKCKSPNKQNFQRCKFNLEHWINFSKIKQHEKECSQQEQYSSSRVEMGQSSEDSVIHSIVNALNIEEEIQNMRKEDQQKDMKKKKKKDKYVQEAPKMTFWVQPTFKQWLKDNPDSIKKVLSNEHSNSDQEDVSVQNSSFSRY